MTKTKESRIDDLEKRISSLDGSTSVRLTPTVILERLTPDMRPVARLVAEGLSNQEIADRLARAESSIDVTLACFRGRFADLIGFRVSRDTMAQFLKQTLIDGQAAA